MKPSDIAPFLSLEQMRRLVTHGGEREQSHADQVQAAFLFFDISGFTKLSDRLTTGNRVEELYRIISSIFGPLADTSLDLGGDVLYFAGDGVGVLFRSLPERDLADATLRAAHAALSVLQKVGVSSPFTGLELRVRVSLGVGACTTLEVGGVEGHWMLVVEGDAVDQARRADGIGTPNALTVSSAAWQQLRGLMQGHAVGSEAFQVTAALTAAPSITAPGGDLEPALLPLAKSYLPAALLHGMEAGAAEWVAELRNVTSLFISIPGAENNPAALQRTLVVCQEEMARAGGVVHEILGDKGAGFLCVTGLPPNAHEDDASRAIQAGSAIRTRLATFGLAAGIGIATGNVFCGIVGSERRRQYEMYGVSMALAARLMQAAEGDGLLVGPRARSEASERMTFEAPVALQLKGFPEPIEAARPAGRRHERRRHTTEMVGRNALHEHILTRIEQQPMGGTVLVCAEAGMGKSMLVDRVLDQAREQGVRVVFGAADSMEQRTSLFTLRSVLTDLFDLPPSALPAEARNAVQQRLHTLLPERAALAPLLNAILPLALPETPLTQQLSGVVRAENLLTLLIDLFRAETVQRPLLVAIEDLHWMDPGSWPLLAKLVDAVPNLLLFGTLRPLDEPPPQLKHLSEGPGRELHVLEALGPDDTATIIARCLQVETVAPQVLNAVFTRSEGIPFYSQEITYALRESRAISVHGSVVDIATAHTTLDLPSNVTGVITGRIDRLPAPIQLSLKVASVLGRYFSLAGLLAIHPMLEDEVECRAHAERLVEVALVVRDEAQGTFLFRHALTHETAYGLLTPSQKGSLHRAAAQRIEAEASDLSKHYGRLVEHWASADEPAKAAHFAGLAGEQALSVWANRTAIQFLTQALELDERARGPMAIETTRARWHRMLGDAWYSIPDNHAALHHYERAFVNCGFPAPRFSWRTPVEVARHVVNRYLEPSPDPDPDVRERCIIALQAFDNLSVLFLWSGEQFSLVHLVFACDNLAQRSGLSPEACLSKNMTGYSLILAGLPAVGMRDIKRAWEMAVEVDDLHARIVTDVFLGLSHTLMGEPDQALPHLRRGWDLSREMGAGLWLHRADYMLGENHLVCGRYEEAVPYFESCALVAKDAEPHTTGFANASVLLCRLRLGAEPESLLPVIESAEVGVPLIRSIDHNFAMQLTFATGVQMEIYLRLGRFDAALELALEELEIVSGGDDTYSYYRGSEAHTQTATVLLALCERKKAGVAGTESVPGIDVLERHVALALKHLKRGYKTFPAVESRYRLMKGVHHRITGDTAAAVRELKATVAYSERVGFPWEVVVANVELARITTGVEQQTHWEAAQRKAAEVGLVWEVSDTPTIGLGRPV